MKTSLDERKRELDDEIKKIDESNWVNRILKKNIRKKKKSTVSAIISILEKQEKAELAFQKEEQSHLLNDPVYKNAVENDDIELIKKFRDRTLTLEEYYENLYEETKTLPCGLFCVKKEGKWGILDKDTGNFLKDLLYDEISEDEYAIVVKYGKSTYLLDKKELKELGRYSGGYSEPRNHDIEFLIIDGKYVLANRKSGKLIMGQKYDEVFIVDGNFTEVKINGKWGLANNNSEIVVEPKYDAICWYDDKNYAYICIGDMSNTRKEGKKWGLINKKTGKVIFEPKYYWIGDFEDDGLAPIELEKGKIHYIDGNGNIVISGRDAVVRYHKLK